MPDPHSAYTDIRPRSWFVRILPGWMQPYARLMRLDRPIGTWLLLLPCWWGLALAGKGFPNPWYMFLFAIGAVVMRSAGCVINDIYDRDLDAAVERTRTRPLVSGEIKLWQAIVLLTLLLLIGLCILLMFNRLTIFTAILSLALVFTYPAMKRVTWWPQLFLGLTFNWGALLGWTAESGHFHLPAFLLYAAGICWTLGYDTIYAHQDIRDDTAAGIKSTARLFGEKSPRWVGGFYAATFLLLALSGWSAGLGIGFYFMLILATGFTVKELILWNMHDPESCLHAFKRNRDFGLFILAAIIVGQII